MAVPEVSGAAFSLLYAKIVAKRRKIKDRYTTVHKYPKPTVKISSQMFFTFFFVVIIRKSLPSAAVRRVFYTYNKGGASRQTAPPWQQKKPSHGV